ncbi:hypothetical protein [Streptomyces sp. enrichment culture]|uniref:hypothetical protein n=1 Tax=Streptomyces sp. enrichment culture TaxID=1795815 RepID=UPI003F566ED5
MDSEDDAAGTDGHSSDDGRTGLVAEGVFWEDWRDQRWLAATPLATAFGSLLLLGVMRNIDGLDWYGALLALALVLVAGGSLTVGLVMPLVLGWDMGRTVVRCSPEGITVEDVTHPWSEVRGLALRHERAEHRPVTDPEGSATPDRYHLDVVTGTGTRRLTAAFLRHRAHDVAELAERFAPGVPVEWEGRYGFVPKGPPRSRQPSRSRVRAETLALVGVSVAFSYLTCQAVLRYAPDLVTYG